MDDIDTDHIPGTLVTFGFVGIALCAVLGIVMYAVWPRGKPLSAVEAQFCSPYRPQCEKKRTAGCKVVGKLTCVPPTARIKKCPSISPEPCEGQETECPIGSISTCVCTGFWECPGK